MKDSRNWMCHLRNFAVPAVCLLLVGCGSSVSKDNYDQINTGMTEAEVEAILGKGEEQASSSVDVPGQSISVPGGGSVSMSGMSLSTKMVKWQDGTKIIGITFSDGKVAMKTQSGL